MSEELPRVDHCLNCGHPVSSRFCPECGQKSEDRNVSLRILLVDIIDDVINLDSRVFRTLIRLVTRPGFLTNEYIAGRRTRYMTPFRVYLAMSVVFFIVLFANMSFTGRDESLSFLPSMIAPPMPPTPQEQAELKAALKELERSYPPDSPQQAALKREGRKAQNIPRPPRPPLPVVPAGRHSNFKLGPIELNLDDLTQTLEEYDAIQKAKGSAGQTKLQRTLTRSIIRARQNPREFLLRFQENLPKMMFVLLPFFALLLKLIYIRSRRYYVEHLTFSMHGHAFVFLMLSVSLLVSTSWVRQAVTLLMAIYLYASMRVVYRQSWAKTAVKFGLLGVLYSVLLAFYLVGTAVVTVMMT